MAGLDAGVVMMIALVAVGIVLAWRYVLRLVVAAAVTCCVLGAVGAYVAIAH